MNATDNEIIEFKVELSREVEDLVKRRLEEKGAKMLWPVDGVVLMSYGVMQVVNQAFGNNASPLRKVGE
jgi:hypothetical protein